MDDNAFLDPFERLLEDVSSPARVRALEAGEGFANLWSSVDDSGFLDALVPEAAGGAGLTLRDVGPLVEALGRHITPAPVAETMAARALLSAIGIEPPRGAIVLATADKSGVARRVPLAMVSDHALIDMGARIDLVRLDGINKTSTGVSDSLSADIHPGAPDASFDLPAGQIRALSAALRSAQIAGAAGRVLDMTVAYANERSQFGKPIGKQQAVQQQISLMAEKMVMIRMAARIGYACDLLPASSAAATAKSVASSAVVEITAIAHAVHGAIGVSQEHDLQLYTRKLHEWRAADGSESFWARILGALRLEEDRRTSADFIRTIYAGA